VRWRRSRNLAKDVMTLMNSTYRSVPRQVTDGAKGEDDIHHRPDTAIVVSGWYYVHWHPVTAQRRIAIQLCIAPFEAVRGPIAQIAGGARPKWRRPVLPATSGVTLSWPHEMPKYEVLPTPPL
jgi:hypothetical protein